MAKNVPLVAVDVDAKIRSMILEKKSVREIRKSLGVSNTKICRIRKEIVTGEPILKASKRAAVTLDKRNTTGESNARTPEEIEALRKEIEYTALARLKDHLDSGEVEVKDINGILAQVGEKPKAQGDTVVMLINSVGNMAIAARQMLIEASRANKQSVIDDGNIIDIPAEKIDE